MLLHQLSEAVFGQINLQSAEKLSQHKAKAKI